MDKFFKISERGSNVKTEIIAGLTTFFAMAYIVITNPNQITSFSTDGASAPFFYTKKPVLNHSHLPDEIRF